MKKFYFLSGLPRTGSTLLASILNQNPDIHVSTNSPVAQIMWDMQNMLFNYEQFKAYPKVDEATKILKSILPNYYCNNKEKIIIDKCRTWGLPLNIKMLQNFVTDDIKIICTVRPIIEILASFIKLAHENPNGSILDHNLGFYYRTLDDARCDKLMEPGGEIDRALFSLHNLLLPENKNMLHLVQYDDLVNCTEETISNIYMFLGIDPFKHDFSSIENKHRENDAIYGLKDMHHVRSTIKSESADPYKILSPYVINKYSNIDFWN